MSKYNYCVTAQQPTVVTHSIKCNFTSPSDFNLIIARCSRLEVHLMNPGELEPLLEFGVFGRIAVLQKFRPKGEDKDRLFVCTESYKFFILAFDEDTKEIITKANGDIKHKIGRPADTGHIGIIDPDCSMIGLHFYDGIFQAIPLAANGDVHREAFDMRFDELQVLQMCFLHGYDEPTLLVLFQDSKEKRYIKSYTVSLRTKELEEGTWSPMGVEVCASWLIPVAAPLGGVIVVGGETVTYYNEKHMKVTLMNPCQIQAWGRIDNNRYLLGDLLGNLHVVVLKQDHTNNKVLSIHVQHLGTTSSAHTISYMDNAHVFIGSVLGDSQLIQLSSSKDSKGNFFKVRRTFPNLGAIVDFCVVDLDRQVHTSIASTHTCMHAYNRRVHTGFCFFV